MVLKPDQERVKTLLKDTITLLCRNGLEFKQNFAVDAVIGVTLDEDEVFLVSINEIVKSESYKAPDSQEHQHEDSAKTSGIPRKRRKHHRVKQAKDVSSVDVSTDGEESETFSAFAEGAQQNESLSKKEPQSDEEESDDLVMIKEELDNWDNSAHDNTSNSPGNLQPFFGDLAEAGSSHSQNFDMSQAQSSGNTGAWPFPGDLSYGSDPSIASPGQFPLRGREPSALGADTSQGQGPQQFPYPCEICGKVISCRSFWKRHMNWHQGKYPYNCGVCGKGCMSTSQLKGHMVTHTGQKEFCCDICFKEFSYNTHLYSHMRKVHNWDKKTAPNYVLDADT